jgi:rhodanese-related sulfurtransferase
MTAAIPSEIDVETLASLTRSGNEPLVLDVREPWEVAICSFQGGLNIPMGDLHGSLNRVPRDENLVVVCHHGMRSQQVMLWLRGIGFDKVSNLRGGINAWAQRVDPSMAVY